jgi:hypothetical protein
MSDIDDTNDMNDASDSNHMNHTNHAKHTNYANHTDDMDDSDDKIADVVVVACDTTAHGIAMSPEQSSPDSITPAVLRQSGPAQDEIGFIDIPMAKAYAIKIASRAESCEANVQKATQHLTNVKQRLDGAKVKVHELQGDLETRHSRAKQQVESGPMLIEALKAHYEEFVGDNAVFPGDAVLDDGDGEEADDYQLDPDTLHIWGMMRAVCSIVRDANGALEEVRRAIVSEENRVTELETEVELAAAKAATQELEWRAARKRLAWVNQVLSPLDTDG